MIQFIKDLIQAYKIVRNRRKPLKGWFMHYSESPRSVEDLGGAYMRRNNTQLGQDAFLKKFYEDVKVENEVMLIYAKAEGWPHPHILYLNLTSGYICNPWSSGVYGTVNPMLLPRLQNAAKSGKVLFLGEAEEELLEARVESDGGFSITGRSFKYQRTMREKVD